MRAVVLTGAGGNDVVEVVERDDPVPGRGELLVGCRFAGLNPADLAQREGRYPAPPGSPQDVPGLEVAGSVVAVGPDVTELGVGDRVFGIVGGGGLADRVVVHERHVARIPDGLGVQESAAVPEVFVTAHDAVLIQAALRPGEVLLVNGANGGVGTAAVQLGRAVGARVLASVRDVALHERVAALGAAVFGPDELVDRVRAEGGADVVLELVGAPNMDANLDALASKARIAVVGVGGGADVTLSLRRLMAKRARVFGTMLRARPHEEKAIAVQAFAREVVPLLAAGVVVPLVDRVFPADEIRAAFDRLAEPGKLGKVLLDFG